VVSGCAAVALGGAAATGVVMTEDRRTFGTITEDQGIELKAATRIAERIKDAHVNVTSYNRMVLLSGEVPNEAAKAEAERVARAVENVRSVFNELQVGANSGLHARSFSPLHVKVVTEAGTVFLMGLVRRQEATDASEVARTTGGVRKVVRLFEYLD
jgi:osmotically-inducible protein OsmY